MGIQSTRHITREKAIKRIALMHGLWLAKDYREAEAVSFEDRCDVRDFIDTELGFELAGIEKWTDLMIEEVMDEPFFRLSMFDNYLIKDDDQQGDE